MVEQSTGLNIPFLASNNYALIVAADSLISNTFQPASPGAAVAVAGKWRGVFIYKPGVEVPFNFEIAGKEGQPKVYLINGEERFDAGSLRVIGDSVIVPLDQFDNELAFKTGINTMEGVFRRQDKTGTAIPVVAQKGVSYRFKTSTKTPTADISGTYDVVFPRKDTKNDSAVGLFKQVGNRVSATILRVTGDSRYLDGVIDGNRFYLSSFIGSSPSYYTGIVSADGKIQGESVGLKAAQPFVAFANESASLPDAYSLTFLKTGYRKFDFSFPTPDGKRLSPGDDKYKNKVLIVTIGGTWCPNCMDEANFLAPWYKANKNRGVEVIAIHYERQDDPAFVNKVLTRFKTKFDIQYDIVFGGLSDKQAVAASLPSLNNFLSFPTTIFIDKQGNVAKIHTGFTGPATGKFYDQFKADFNAEVDELLGK
ncbi:TlpA disulfide reductase family protein [Segetibacter sp. 3557_3]|uniref:TlpA disulfide reductase family protein n=1 Tax=Segetibacter sp. 3557_3 TaxID=2547429 RepID=UPI0014045685|nr:TlpA disulfide reductase family protein [Segetibacter sp. 3557_3]